MRRTIDASAVNAGAAVFAVVSLVFFTIPLFSKPDLDDLTRLRGVVTDVADHKPRRAGPHLRVRLDTLSSSEWVSVQYDANLREAAHKIATGDDVEVLAQHDSLGRQIWFAWDVRSDGRVIIGYNAFLQRQRRQDSRLRVAGIVVGAFAACLLVIKRLLARGEPPNKPLQLTRPR